MNTRLLVILVFSLFISPAQALDVVLPKLKPVPPPPSVQVVILPKLKNAVAPVEQAPPVVAPAPQIIPPKAVEKWPEFEVIAARQACAKLLNGLDMKFVAMEPIGAPNSCGAVAPVLISSIQGVAIAPPAEANCAFANALYHWITTSVVPSARDSLGKKLISIGNASAYVCRRRNNSATGKMSEHAIANALDISTLKFADGTTMNIKGDWGGVLQKLGFRSGGGFLGQIRKDACIRFTTVLGPGSDPYHGDHFHIDRAFRKGGYRICK